jgi:hypothetical protein
LDKESTNSSSRVGPVGWAGGSERAGAARGCRGRSTGQQPPVHPVALDRSPSALRLIGAPRRTGGESLHFVLERPPYTGGRVHAIACRSWELLEWPERESNPRHADFQLEYLLLLRQYVEHIWRRGPGECYPCVILRPQFVVPSDRPLLVESASRDREFR